MTKPLSANLNILKADTESAIARIGQYRRENKKKAELVVLAGAAISALTTIAIGMSSVVPSCSALFQGAALILSASLTILTAWDGLYNHKRLWLLQAGVLNSLYQIQTEIKHLEASGQIDQDAVDALYLRYQAAFDEYNSQWTEMRADDRQPVPDAGNEPAP
jgi:hypothetical protein